MVEATKAVDQALEINILKEIGAAVKRLGMYPPEHPAAIKAVEKSFLTLQQLFKDADGLTISKVDDKIVVNGKSVEGAILPERLKEEFQQQNTNSLTLFKTLTREELGKFLNFFVRPLDHNAPRKDLTKFLRQNRIRSIQVNESRYELVSDDEVVVKSEILEGAELKAQISTIVKQNPDLVTDVLLNKPVKPESVSEKIGTEVNSDQLVQGIDQHVKNLTDDQVLSLLASGVEFTLKESKGKDKNLLLSEVTSLLNKLLQDREKERLLPEVKRILSGHRIPEEEYFDFIFEEKWLKTQAVLDELTSQVDKLGIEEIDFERFTLLLGRLMDSKEEKIRLHIVDKLLFNLDSKNGQTRRLSVLALKDILSRGVSGKREAEFVYLKDRLYDKIKNQQVSNCFLKDSGELVRIIFLELIQRNEFEEARKIVSEYKARLNLEVFYPGGAREVARDFVKEVSDQSTLSLLVARLQEVRTQRDTKVIEEILESLDGDKVARELVEVFTVDDRATRISSLRVLSKLGRSSTAALSGLLGSISTFPREKRTRLLGDEYWYKVRNAIYVLGNVSDPSSVEVLLKLSSDPDTRVRLEVIKALTKIQTQEAADGLLTFLNDTDHQVRKNAITSLTMIGDKRCLKSLMDHFHNNREDRTSTLNAIGKIGGAESVGFVLELLSQEDSGIGRLSSREDEEIKITALDLVGKLGSAGYPQVKASNLAEEVQKLIKQRKKGIKGLLVKDRVAEKAQRVLTMIDNGTSPPSPVVSNSRNRIGHS